MEAKDRQAHRTTDDYRQTGRNLPLILYGIIVLLLGVSGYLLYSNQQLQNKATRQEVFLRQTVQQNQLANDRQQLIFGLKTFAWAVRNAVLQNKIGEINEYFNTLVKDRGIKEMLLIDPNGRVILSTNKKNQDILFTNRFPGYLLQQEEVYFNPKTPYEVSAPILGTNQRLGTLVMFYAPASLVPPADSLSK